MAEKPSYEELLNRVSTLEENISERKQVEEKTATLNRAVEQSFDGIAMVDKEAGFTYVNKAYAAMHGYSPEEMIGMNVEDVHDPEQIEWDQGLKNHVDTQRSYIGEIKHIRRDGTSFSCLDSFTVLDGDSVKPMGTVAICKDISKYKQMKKTYLDLAGVIFVAINTKGEVTQINKKGCEVLGYEEEEVVGKNWFDNFLPERLKDEVKEISESLLSKETGLAKYFENPVVTRRGEERLILWHNSPLRNEEGEIIGHLSSGTDITERKQTEERLRQYENIVSCSTDMLALIDEDFIYLAANDAYARAFGLVRDEVIGHSMSEVFGEEVFESRIKPNAEKCLEGESVFYERWVTSPEGRKRYMEMRYFPYLGPNNERKGIVVNARNMTVRKQEQELLHRGLKINRALARMSSSMVGTSDALSDITDTTLKYARLLTGSEHGYVSVIDKETGANISYTITKMMDKECLISGKDKHFVFPLNPDGRYPNLWGHALNTRGAFYANAPESHESSGGLPPGHIPIKNFLSVPALLGDRLVGQVALANSKEGFSDSDLEVVSHLAKLFAIAVGRKETNDTLAESEEKYRTLIGNVLGMVYRGKPDWSTEVISNSESISGYTVDEFLSKKVNWLELIHPDDKSRIISESLNLAQKPSELVQEYRITAKDGNVRWVSDSKKSYFKEGVFQEIDGIVADITQQKEAEKDRDALQAQLFQSQKMEAIGTLAGGVAHDFNNILTTIIGNCHLALTSLHEEDPMFEDIQDIKRAGERAADLTRQLLAFSRKQLIKPRVLDINEVLTDMGKMISRLIGEDIEISVIAAPELWLVEADPGQIEQIVMNLVVNAMDAMPEGGKLTVETANVELDEGFFRKHGVTGQIGNFVMLAISDNGIGMDRETQERIFEPFFTSKASDKGTGLGLSTIYGIVKQNEGFIWVYTEPRQGSTFKVYLPKTKGSMDPESEDQYFSNELGGSETVLIVEDDDSVRKLARTSLKRNGYRILEAENGENALRVSEAHDGSIDLILTDVVMPKMSGKDLAELVEKIHPRVKVIFMSGYTNDAIVNHGILTRGVEFIEKPFTPKNLASKVRAVLDKKG